MANEIYYVKTLLQKAIEEDNLGDFKRYCTRYMVNTDLGIVTYS